MKTDPEFTLPPRSELDKLPYGHVYARMADGMWFPANGTYSTGAVTDLHGALHMLQEKLLPIVTQEGKGTWEDYALQFPVNTEDTITFDFDPTYMTGAYSRATFASIVHTVPGAKMLAVLRDPSELACRKRGPTARPSSCPAPPHHWPPGPTHPTPTRLSWPHTLRFGRPCHPSRVDLGTRRSAQLH